jgi:tetratricopeptide (TPR) repeat protein
VERVPSSILSFPLLPPSGGGNWFRGATRRTYNRSDALASANSILRNSHGVSQQLCGAVAEDRMATVLLAHGCSCYRVNSLVSRLRIVRRLAGNVTLTPDPFWEILGDCANPKAPEPGTVPRRVDNLIANGDHMRPESKSAREMLDEGKALVERGDSDSALRFFTAAIESDPELDEAYFRRADIHYEKGDYDNAIADYTEVIRVVPDMSEVWKNRALAFLDKGNIDDAIKDDTEAIRLDPDDAVAYYNRANAFSQKGDSAKAIADYDAAIRLDPKLAAAYHNRGYEFSRCGDLDRAFADYTTAIRVGPSDACMFNSRGIAYKQQGDLDKAIADYTEAIRLDPRYANAYSNRGNACSLKDDFDKAIADYTEAIRLDPKSVHSYYGRGSAFAFAENDDPDKAISDLTEAIRLDPNMAVAYCDRGFAYGMKEDFENAINDLTQAILLDPTSVMAHYNRGVFLADVGWLLRRLRTCPRRSSSAPIPVVHTIGADSSIGGLGRRPRQKPTSLRLRILDGSRSLSSWSRVKNPKHAYVLMTTKYPPAHPLFNARRSASRPDVNPH